jgi:hypothetical protein
MSEAGESKISPRFPRTIAEMGPWDFQASADSLALTDEDQAAIDDGTATPEQLARLQVVGQMARHALMSADAGHPFGKPS